MYVSIHRQSTDTLDHPWQVSGHAISHGDPPVDTYFISIKQKYESDEIVFFFHTLADIQQFVAGVRAAASSIGA